MISTPPAVETSRTASADPHATADTTAGGDGPSAHLWKRWSALPRTDPRRARWLAEIRRGAGKPAGVVPQMWPHYTPHDGRDADDITLSAEHICLVLFGFHQQSTDDPMHVQDQTLPQALRKLRGSARFAGREAALDEKLFAAVTATSLVEMQWHLRSLIPLLKAEGLGFNYSRLCQDLETWQRPGGPDRVRRRWGRDYFWRQTSAQPDAPTPAANASKGNTK